MKKTIITAAFALGLTASASAASLVAEWDGFTNLTNGNYTLSLAGGSVNGEGVLHVDSTNGTYTDRPTVDISAAALTLSDGMSVSFTAKSYNTWGNRTLVSFASEAYDFTFAFGTAKGGAANFYFNGSDGRVADIGTQGSISPGSDFAVFTLTSAVINGVNTFTVYMNGAQVAQGSTSATTGTGNGDCETLMSSTLSRLTLGGWSGNSDGGNIAFDIDHLALHDGALSATEALALYQDWTKAVPEPATATLSLLALAGLAARRRRK